MKIPLWLLVILFAGWTAWTVNRVCNRCGCCGEGQGQAAGDTTATVRSSGVPLFRWGNAQPEADPNFKDFKMKLLKGGGQGDSLLITGYYCRGEKTTGNFANLGLARADAIRAMMKPEIPENRVHIAAQERCDSLKEGGPPREMAGFSWQKMVLKKEEGAIIEADNAVIILFPTNSTVKDKDPKVDEYLKALCEKHKADNATFTVVGHADNVGSDEQNNALSLGRAKAIAAILERNGIAKSRIQTSSKGKTEPVADNNTEDGRHQNRRVVITVNR